ATAASSIRFPQQCVRKLHSEFSCHVMVQNDSLNGDLFNRQVARPLSEQDASRQLGSGKPGLVPAQTDTGQSPALCELRVVDDEREPSVQRRLGDSFERLDRSAVTGDSHRLKADVCPNLWCLGELDGS